MLIVTLKLLLFGIAALSWIACFVSQLLIMVNRKPGIKLFQLRLVFNPFLIQFGGRYYLTNQGIYWRNVS